MIAKVDSPKNEAYCAPGTINLIINLVRDLNSSG
jgi:hypothetical protein